MKEEMVVVGNSGGVALVRGEATSACGSCSKCHVTASGNLLEVRVPEEIEVGRRILVDTGPRDLTKDNRARALVGVLGFTAAALVASAMVPGAADAVLIVSGFLGGGGALYLWSILWKKLRRRPRFIRLVEEVKSWEPMAATSNISLKASGLLKKTGGQPALKN